MKTNTTAIVSLHPIQAMLLIVRAIAHLTTCTSLPAPGRFQRLLVKFFDLAFVVEAENEEGTQWKISLEDEDKHGTFESYYVSTVFQSCRVDGSKEEAAFRCKQEILHWLIHLYESGDWEYLPEWNQIPNWPFFEAKEREPISCYCGSWDELLGQQD